MLKNNNSRQKPEVKSFRSFINREKTARPRLNLPLGKFEVFLEALAAAGLLAYIAIFLVSWQNLPDIVPTNFDLAGKATSWGSKNYLILFLALGLIIYAGMTIISRFPHIFNYTVAINKDNAPMQYVLARQMLAFIKLIIIAMFAYINYITYGAFQNPALNINAIIIPVFIIVLFGGLGIYIYFSFKFK